MEEVTTRDAARVLTLVAVAGLVAAVMAAEVTALAGVSPGATDRIALAAVLTAASEGSAVDGASGTVEYVLPAALGAGASGSFWTTDLKVLNVGQVVARYRLLAVPNGGTLGEPLVISAVRTLSPDTSEHLDNVVLTELHLDTFSGSLFIDVLEGKPVFDSRIWSKRRDGSVVGQRVAPMRCSEASGAEAFIPIIDGEFRVNLYVVAWASVAVTITAVDDEGAGLAHWERELADGQTLQINDLLTMLGPGEHAHGILVGASGPVSTGASVVDNRGAQDPTWFEGLRTGATDAWAVAVSDSGANGSRWQTDAWVRNPGDEDHEVRLVVWADGEAHGSTMVLGARRLLVLHDLVAEWAHLAEGGGALQMTSNGEVQVATRTYSTSADGSTSGQAIPLVARGLASGDSGLLFGLEKTRDSRINLGYVNAQTHGPVEFTRVIEDTEGRALDRRTISLGASEWYQENDVLEPFSDSVDARVEISLVNGGSSGFANLIAYASTVANEPARPPEARHNDPTYQPAHVLRAPDCEPAPRELTVMLPGGVPLELVFIPAGTSYRMGAAKEERGSMGWERPPHQVTIAHDFYIGRYEITQGQWQVIMGSNPSRGYGVGGSIPVYYVSWNDIAGSGGFVEELNAALGTSVFRLPTEAEWECAARAGTTTEFSFAVPADWDLQCGEFEAAEPWMWWCGDTWLSGPEYVGGKLPNPWGLFDLHGNVWELVQDVFHPDFIGAPEDGSAWTDPPGPYRVLRGGGWNEPASYCRSAARIPLTPDHKCFNTGFRIAASAPCPGLASPAGQRAVPIQQKGR